MTQEELPQAEPQHQAVSVAQFNTLVKTIREKEQAKDEVQAQLTGLNKEIERLRAKAVEYLDELGQENFSTPHGTVYKREIRSVSVPKTPEARKEFFAWLEREGLHDQMITVNQQKLTSLYNAKLEEAEGRGEGFFFKIPGIAEPTVYTTLGVRKAK
jgi:site-specific recombinase XerD